MNRKPSSPFRRSSLPALLGLTAALGLAPSVVDAAPYQGPFPKRDTLIQGNGAMQRSVGGGSRPLALMDFSIDYADRWDTNVRDIGVELIENRRLRAWLGDDDSRSPVTARVNYRDLGKSPSVEYRHLSATCRAKTCTVGFLERGSDKIPLLAGFAFHNLGGAQKITGLGVFPEVRTGPNAQIKYKAKFDTDGRVNYSVDVYVILVDPSVIAGTYNATGRSETNKPFAKVPLRWEATGLLALQGFDVRFLNGSHELQELAIKPVRGNNSVEAVYFSDKNDDDPIEAKLWWVDLKAPGIKVIPMDRPPQPKPNHKGPTPQINPDVRPSGGSKGKPSPKLPQSKHRPRPKQNGPRLPKGVRPNF